MTWPATCESPESSSQHEGGQATVRYALIRLAQLMLMLFIGSIVIFLVIQNSPGDPALIRLGLDATPEQIDVERERLGLDKSLPERYAIWLTQALRLDLGNSFTTGQPVTEVIGSALAYTAQLAIVAAILALLVGVTLGIVAALRRGSRTDVAISTFAASSLSIPGFALGTVLILIVSVELGLLPPAGAGQPGQSFGAAVEFTLMPAFTLAIPVAAVLIRYIRVALGETMAQDYIVTARSKGLKRSTIVMQHGLRNALIPTITVAGIQLGGLLAGAVVVETVFSYPGLGRLTIQAIRGVDYPVVQGALLLAAAIFLILTFLVDIAYGLIDPRIRVQ